MNKTFYLARHGLATHSKIGYGDKVYTAELLPEGILPIERMAEYLQNAPTDINVSSQLIRCRQTTEIISKKTGKEFIFDKRLNEYWPESIEPFLSFHDRIQNFLEDIVQKETKSILICTHGSGIVAIKNFILRETFNESHLFDFSKTGTLVIIKNGKIETLDFN